MINLQLSVREAMELAIYAPVEMRERITNAFEVALGVNQRRMVTITGGMTTDNRILCIKAIRQHTGWGLKEAKDWTDVIVGYYDQFGKWRVGGANQNTMTLKTPEAAESLLCDLIDLGCEGFLS
jgi:hypothetical protein